MQSIESKETKSILLASDVHESWEHLDKLEKIAKNYDIVLISSDQANVNNDFM